METNKKEQVRPLAELVEAVCVKRENREADKEQIKKAFSAIEASRLMDDSSQMLCGMNYNDFYFFLNKLVRNYGTLLAEHDPKFGDFSRENASQDLYFLGEIIERLEPMVQADSYSGASEAK